MAFESCGTGKPYGPVFATGQYTYQVCLTDFMSPCHQTCVADYPHPCRCCALTASWERVAGDTVGALLNRTTKTISFTKNGLDLGVAFNNVNESLLFPSVGMRTPNEEVLLESLQSSILRVAHDMQMCATA